MQVITFIEQCTVLLESNFDLIDMDCAVERTFYPGDTERVEEIKELDNGLSYVLFSDETKAVIQTDYFLLTWEDD